jgi:hypothetical protein
MKPLHPLDACLFGCLLVAQPAPPCHQSTCRSAPGPQATCHLRQCRSLRRLMDPLLPAGVPAARSGCCGSPKRQLTAVHAQNHRWSALEHCRLQEFGQHAVQMLRALSCLPAALPRRRPCLALPAHHRRPASAGQRAAAGCLEPARRMLTTELVDGRTQCMFISAAASAK